MTHRPVMLAQALSGLAVREGGIYVDGTFGRGGHSAAILDTLRGSGALHALDCDPQAAAHAWQAFAAHPGQFPNFLFHARNFAELGALGAELGLRGRVDGLLLDLGVSSPQLDEAARGFSFTHDGPADMRMDPRSGESAAQWLARAPEAEIADVLWRYGEERNSRRIARRIVETRTAASIETTQQLAALIAAVPGPRSKSIHPATRSFQAIRIHINQELAALEAALVAAPALLAPGGRLAVIAFHSLEDRIVKRFLREAAGRAPVQDRSVFADPRVPDARRAPTLRLIAREFPSEAECAANPRARSAVLRVAERTDAETCA